MTRSHRLRAFAAATLASLALACALAPSALASGSLLSTAGQFFPEGRAADKAAETPPDASRTWTDLLAEFVPQGASSGGSSATPGIEGAAIDATAGSDAEAAAADDPQEDWEAALAAIAAAAEAREESVTLDLPFETVERAARAFEYDPFTFYLADWPVIYELTDGQMLVELSYRYTPSEAADILARCDEAAEQILAAVPADADDWTRALVAHDELCRYVRAPVDGESDMTTAYGEPEFSHTFRCIDGALLGGVAVCQGYAVAYQYLLQKLGIECSVVVSSDHAWNVVNIDGGLYHVDAMSNDCDELDPWGEPYIDHSCFMLTTADMEALENTVSQDETPLPELTATEANYHVRTGCTFDEFDRDAIVAVWTQQVASGTNMLTVRLSTSEAWQQLNDLVDYAPYEVLAMANEAAGTTARADSILRVGEIGVLDVFLA